MTVCKFCREATQPNELVVIRLDNWIVASVWIDYEDLFMIPEKLHNYEVKKDEWGQLSFTTEHGDKIKVPVHYIDIFTKENE